MPRCGPATTPGSDVAPNEQQSAAWNGPEADHYVEQADRYDLQLRPVTEAMLRRAAVTTADEVLDVGCGTGATTLAVARRAARVVGLDISAPLVEVARCRAAEASIDVELVVADAQTHRFDGGFDVVVSQLGLMFFDDPVVAFANLRSALRPGGRLAFTSWRPLEDNEWLLVLARARPEPLPRLGGLAAGPGMFALQDLDEITGLLESAGFADVVVDPLAVDLLLGGGGSLDDAVQFLLDTGIGRGLLGDLAPEARPSAVGAVRAALAQRYEDGSGVRIGAATWLVTARA